MSRERLENLSCIDRCAEKNGTYEMNGHCSNCGLEYVLVIPKGHAAPGSFSGWRCGNCGCSRVGADPGKPAEPLFATEGRTEEQAVVEVMERWAMRARAVTGGNLYAEGKREAYEIAWGELAAALARSTPADMPTCARCNGGVCVRCAGDGWEECNEGAFCDDGGLHRCLHGCPERTLTATPAPSDGGEA